MHVPSIILDRISPLRSKDINIHRHTNTQRRSNLYKKSFLSLEFASLFKIIPSINYNMQQSGALIDMDFFSFFSYLSVSNVLLLALRKL